MTELKPTNLIAIEVPINSGYFTLDGIDNTILAYSKNRNLKDSKWSFVNIGYQYKIIGEVTKGSISFDVANLGDFLLDIEQANSLLNHNDKIDFRKLLLANGLFFVNPMQKPNGEEYYDNRQFSFDQVDSVFNTELFNSDMDKWKLTEDKLVKGKLLIIQKLT